VGANTHSFQLLEESSIACGLCESRGETFFKAREILNSIPEAHTSAARAQQVVTSESSPLPSAYYNLEQIIERIKSKGNLLVLDALCGCGIWSLRYLVEAKADFVLANDANDNNKCVILHNLPRGLFDLIDIDSFGIDSMFMRTAFSALKLDGLLYLTSTDDFSSGWSKA
ncbi:hypothetical protein RJ641_035826, partial [Dillenia turbinata]